MCARDEPCSSPINPFRTAVSNVIQACHGAPALSVLEHVSFACYGFTCTRHKPVLLRCQPLNCGQCVSHEHACNVLHSRAANSTCPACTVGPLRRPCPEKELKPRHARPPPRRARGAPRQALPWRAVVQACATGWPVAAGARAAADAQRACWGVRGELGEVPRPPQSACAARPDGWSKPVHRATVHISERARVRGAVL